ncbi:MULTISPECIES: SDR family NAD(P)-dependent oxidoreductase [Streptomyces]|uniref:SDR family NAD(P)-dependent oxidoreductase n=1 Tax=Streptomyces TaxID=1883 RepID=UPI00163C4FAB|nr:MULTISPECIES: SDR family NAD(P)-dependent oxidoreductase [Streptomyces]MBC2875777.1 SDR family NAD(P)-dependent oxidoreductase [Streptomyces sp. TYQ1024]UBI37629.1 SDR family NAD(P)-dependent oxidoreductase [Streptomyces mobaraensis]UKW30216.1 SDR family NAD(P)-dependent oxidoreductase [Streptomyces sp. TYQ1024]
MTIGLEKGQRAVVTGGAGFIGSHLCERLVERGLSVTAVDNLSTGRAANVEALAGEERFTLLVADVTEPFHVEGPVHHVVHLASPASPLDYLALPLETLRVGSAGTENALRLALEHGARFVVASTSEVYGDPVEHPQPETYWGNVNPIGLRSVYDEAKRFTEALTAAYARTLGADTGIARLFNSYGPRMRREDGRVVPTFIDQALAGEPLTINGSGEQTRSLCYVEDTVRGLLALMESSFPGPVNIGATVEMTVREIAEAIAAHAGVELRTEYRPPTEDEPGRRRPDIETARTKLGWQPEVPLAEGIKRTLDWWQTAYPRDTARDGVNGSSDIRSEAA